MGSVSGVESRTQMTMYFWLGFLIGASVNALLVCRRQKHDERMGASN